MAEVVVAMDIVAACEIEDAMCIIANMYVEHATVYMQHSGRVLRGTQTNQIAHRIMI